MFKKFLKMMTALAVVGFTGGQAMAATVSLTQGNPILASEGAVLNLNLVGADFIPAVDAAAFTFNWNADVLSYIGTAVTGPWDTSSVNDANAASGVVDFVFLGTSGAAVSNFDIATMSFNVIGVEGDPLTGSTIIDFEDSGFGGWIIPGGEPYPDVVTYTDGEVTVVSAVPVPAAVWLFGSGLLGLVGVARRRRSVHAV